MLYGIVKWIHVLAAIAAVGANFTYGIWTARARREPSTLPFVLSNISLIDRRVANPCYAVLLITGLTMALIARIPLTTPWLLSAIVLYILATLLGILAYAPATRQQRRILEIEGFESSAYRAVTKRTTWLGLVVTLDVVIIVFLMVVKPPLWR